MQAGTEVTATWVSSGSWLRTSGDPKAAAISSAGVGIVLRHKADWYLLDWISVDIRLCAVPLTNFA